MNFGNEVPNHQHTIFVSLFLLNHELSPWNHTFAKFGIANKQASCQKLRKNGHTPFFNNLKFSNERRKQKKKYKKQNREKIIYKGGESSKAYFHFLEEKKKFNNK